MFKIVLTELAESLWWPDHWEHFRSGPRTVDSGQWTVDSGQWTPGTGTEDRNAGITRNVRSGNTGYVGSGE